MAGTVTLNPYDPTASGDALTVLGLAVIERQEPAELRLYAEDLKVVPATSPARIIPLRSG
jgi:hypothetical protein